MGIVVVDYGMGNLRSVHKALEHVGFDAIVSGSPNDVRKAEKLVLPGVGAFGDAMRELRGRELVEPLLEGMEGGVPFLGICLGLQLLLGLSYEGGEQEGLGIFAGAVRRFDASGLKVPHMGWNEAEVRNDCPIFAGLPKRVHMYFVHSYYADVEDNKVVAAETEYGIRFASALWKENIFGTQFHPEKSQRWGLKLLRNFGGL